MILLHKLFFFDVFAGAGLSISCLGQAPRGPRSRRVQKGSDKLDLTRFSGNKFRSTSVKGTLDLLRLGLRRTQAFRSGVRCSNHLPTHGIRVCFVHKLR
ncbi:hypothetical protein TNCV_2972821 [Trichonephila clavipes]|nr:hypothetical protein TNCV_2972821 [Trichonephila clavipes]